MIEVNTLAKAIHESNREAVESGNVIRKLGALNEETGEVTAPKPIKFFEWDELDDTGKEGKRLSARYLLDHFNILPQHREMVVSIDVSEVTPKSEWLFNWKKTLEKVNPGITFVILPNCNIASDSKYLE